MKTYLDNLRPLEKRLVVGVGAVLFIVLNLVFVVPHFSDWDRVKWRMAKAQKNLGDYSAEIQKTNEYDKQIKILIGPDSYVVPAEEQSQHFQSAIQSQADQAGITLLNSTHVSRATNQFFLELSQTVSVQTKEQQLVDLLYNLGAGNSMIRVRALTLKPDQTRQHLNASITLEARYQKKQMPRGATSRTGAATSTTSAPFTK